MNWLKRKLEIQRLKKLNREKLWEMMRVDLFQNFEREKELEHEIDKIRARIAELCGDAE